jgi:RNA polymerase sigma-70 factor (ECF subfamily)
VPDGRQARPTRAEVAERWGDRIYTIAYRLTGNPHDAADLSQDVYLRIHAKLEHYQPGTFDGWIYRVTKNMFLDSVRRQNRMQTQRLGDENWSEPVSTELEPADVVDRRTLEARLQRGLDRLPPNFRLAVVLSDIENLTYDEIARITGWPTGTVRSRIHRGRSRLRAWLEESIDVSDDAAPAAPSAPTPAPRGHSTSAR